jgi:hypothetical protein
MDRQARTGDTVLLLEMAGKPNTAVVAWVGEVKGKDDRKQNAMDP